MLTLVMDWFTPTDAVALRARFDRQRQAFQAEPAPDLPARRAQLQRLREAVLCHRAAITAAIDADFSGRNRHETALLEIVPLLHGIDYLSGHLKRLMRPQPRRVGVWLQPGRAFVQYQPLGVVGVIAPWNYPLGLALMPLATALAAGNRIMLKPSERTPRIAALLADLLAACFPPEQVDTVLDPPEGAGIGPAFARLPFDHLIFTGSTRIGRAVMAEAAANLTPLTLELGGKSPALLGPDAALAPAAASIAHGKLVNAGQTCIAPDYALVPRAALQPFADALCDAARRLYPAGAASPDLTRLIDQRAEARLLALLADARAKGAVLRPFFPGQPQPMPCLVLGATPAMQLMQEEIFGPVLPLLPYADLESAIGYIAARPRPLALYYFGQDSAARDQVLRATCSGNVTVNGTLLHYAVADLPFGGVGESGIGAYHGREGFRRLSHAKGVFLPGRPHPSLLVRPPYGALVTRLQRFWFRG